MKSENLLDKKKKLNKQLDEVEHKLAEQQHEKDLKEWKPIPMQDFYDYMTEFAKYTMDAVYEPWEFSSEDMDGIINMALKAGIRDDMPDTDNADLMYRIGLADEARKVFGGVE